MKIPGLLQRGCGVLLGLACWSLTWAESPPVAPPPRSSRVTELIRQLGSVHFREREAASQELAALDVLEPPIALFEAVRSDNPEVRNRAADAIKAIRLQAIERVAKRLERGRKFAEKGQIDLFVAATAVWELPAEDDRLWHPPLDLAVALAKRAKPFVWPPQGGKNPLSSLAMFRERVNPRFIRNDEPHEQEPKRPIADVQMFYPGAIMTRGASSRNAFVYNILVSRGNVHARLSITHSIVYAQGNVTSNELYQSVIVCDGDVKIEKHISASLVVARGDITAERLGTGTILLAGGCVKLGSPINQFNSPVPRVKEKVMNPLDFVSFFELSTIGVEVELTKNMLRVKTVSTPLACAKAGIQPGDTILTVEGNMPENAESLRRRLRDALAIGDATLSLKRGDKLVTVRVSLSE